MSKKNNTAKQIFTSAKPKDYAYAQDIIDVEDIVYGLLKMKDGRYIKVVEVEPVNFRLKEVSEQNYIIESFAEWLRVCPAKFQIKVLTKKADANTYLDKLAEQMGKETTQSIKAIGDNYYNLIKTQSLNVAITRRLFLLFEYEKNNILSRQPSERLIANEMNHMVAQIESNYFSKMGNVFLKPLDDDIYLTEFLYMLYNRSSYLHETFQDRFERIINDAMKLNENNPGVTEDVIYENLPLADLIAPKGIDFERFSDCYLMDGMYRSHFYISSTGYPTTVPSCWLIDLLNGIDYSDLDIYVRKEDRSQFLQKLKYLGNLSRNIVGDSSTQVTQDMRSTHSAIQYFQSALSGELGVEQDPFYVSVVVTLTGRTYAELLDKKTSLMNLATTKGLEFIDMDYSEDYGFLASCPFNNIPKKIYDKSKRNVTTDGLSGFYPFTSFELCDDDGILLGINRQNKSLCVLDLFDTEKYHNANMLILGDSGVGKTFLFSLIAMRLRLLGIQVFIMTAEKPFEFKRLADHLDGSYVKIGPASSNTINILEIQMPSSDAQQVIYGYGENDKKILMEKVQEIITWFSLLIPNLSQTDENKIDLALVKLYKKFGITEDNNSIYINPKNKALGLKKMPILSDLYAILKDENEVSETVLSTLEKFVNGSAKSFNQQTNVDLDNSLIVFDLEGLTKSFEAGVTFQVLSAINSKMKEDPTKKQIVLIEEGWKFISSSANKKAAENIQELFKTIRGYGGGAIMSTQEIADLTASDYGKSVIQACSFKMVLKYSEAAIEQLQDILKISDKEAKSIVKYDKTGLLIANNNRLEVLIKASSLEKDLITTDRKDLEKQYNEKV